VNDALKIAVLAHISSEIAHANEALVLQRTRNNLIVAFGPFFLLWIVMSSHTASVALTALVGQNWLVLLIAILAAYAALGLIAAIVEEKMWNHANFLRKQYADISGIPVEYIEMKTTGLYIFYVLIFFFLGLAFALIFLLGVGRLSQTVQP